MVQSGEDYRAKNRKRLQRFYKRQKAEGKKRLSITLSPTAYTKLKADRDNTGSTLNAIVENAIMEAGSDSNTVKVSDEAYALLIDVKEQTGESMPILIDRAVTMAYGTQGILDIDDPALNEDVIPNFEGPSQDGIPLTDVQEDDVEEIELEITLVNQETDDAALVDQEPETATDDTPDTDQGNPATNDTTPDLEPVKETLPERPEAPTQDPDPQGDDLIPDCTGKEITLEERDKILVQVAEALADKENIQNRVDLLNEKSVPVNVKAGKYGGTWDKKKFSNNLRLAKKRLGDQEPVTDDTANLPNTEHDQTHDTTTDAKAPVESSGADGTDLGDQIPDCTGRTIDRQERDEILVQVAEAMPDKSQAQDRVTLLNAKSVPVSVKPGQYGGEWTRKKFTDNLRFAKKRLGVK